MSGAVLIRMDGERWTLTSEHYSLAERMVSREERDGGLYRVTYRLAGREDNGDWRFEEESAESMCRRCGMGPDHPDHNVEES